MFSASMGGTDITNDSCIGPKSTAFYELCGKGGTGAVTVSECMVHPETDGSYAYHLDTIILNSLALATYTADAISRHGTVASLELSRLGMYAGTYMTDNHVNILCINGVHVIQSTLMVKKSKHLLKKCFKI